MTGNQIPEAQGSDEYRTDSFNLIKNSDNKDETKA
ncbi:MAG: hypothetical protein JWQ23_3058 [Herminiimonas sp.]|jgi:hypothetical protein|nr:hypothetical protein [Herminiimonas sp.]